MPRRLFVVFGLAGAMLIGCRQSPRTENTQVDTTFVYLNPATGLGPASNQVFMESLVEEKPEILSAPPLRYPPRLQQARIQGRVVVQLILDTLGRAEPSSVKVIQSPDSGFDQQATAYVLHARFSPARNHGRAVRVLLNIPIDFKITR